MTSTATESMNVNGNTLDEVKLPKFLFSSLDYVKFVNKTNMNNPDKADDALISYLQGTQRACEQVLKSELKQRADPTATLESKQLAAKRLYTLYIRMGHICLLAHDYAKALSVYQKAYKCNENEYFMDAAALYGLGLAYFHFRAYMPSIQVLNQLLYCHPYTEVAADAHARLGIAYKCLDNFGQAIKHLSIAFEAPKEFFLPRSYIRFQIANCYDAAGDLRRAVDEYRRLISDCDNKGPLKADSQLIASIYARLGWISLLTREKETREEVRHQKLKEAESLLYRARELSAKDSQINCFLGLCFSEQTRLLNKLDVSTEGSVPHPQFASLPSFYKRQANQAAQNAFISFRAAIDTDETDEKNWRSIGLLYKEQTQPLDALQSLACAVQLDEKYSAAWVDLGSLYESNRQFSEALFCYKKALRYNSDAPQSLKARVSIIEKELDAFQKFNSLSLSFIQRNSGLPQLPSLESAWNLGLPTQVRQRLLDSRQKQHSQYREKAYGVWSMSQLAANSLRHSLNFDEVPGLALTSTQRQIMEILKLNKEQLEHNELSLLQHLEERQSASENYGMPRTAGGGGLHNKQAEAMSYGDVGTLFSNELDSFLPCDAHATRQQPTAGALPTSTQTNDQEHSNFHKTENEHDVPSLGKEPPPFSLLATVNVPITTTSAEILEICKKRLTCPEEYKPIFDEKISPPKPPSLPSEPLPKEKLLLQTPLIIVENSKEAMMSELQTFCYNTPIAIIRGLTAVLKIDLSLFSTKTLIQIASDHEVEVRTQYKMPVDVNLDHLGNPTWAIRSSKSVTKIGHYGQYQAESFKFSLKEETEKLKQPTPKQPSASSVDGALPKKRKSAAPASPEKEEPVPYKMLKFGTNVDLSDEKKFYYQLKELHKMPSFCRINSAANMLTYLGHTVLGMNTVQLYMKVPGCRTPGHLENNSFASININIGPGECEWFGVPYEYWPVLEQMCKERDIDFLRGAWWPSVEDLIAADVPFYRFTQKAGDLVWIGGGCVHWVQSLGWCNNIAWNVGPMTANQVEMALTAHEWNRLNGYQSLVPMQHLCWQLARGVYFSNQKMYNKIKNALIRSFSYCVMLRDFISDATKLPIKGQQRMKGEAAHYCHLCDLEVFNILFVKEVAGKFYVHCFVCANRNLEEFIMLQQYTIEELSAVFDAFQLHPAKSSLIC